jgi:hypothetical protein
MEFVKRIDSDVGLHATLDLFVKYTLSSRPMRKNIYIFVKIMYLYIIL